MARLTNSQKRWLRRGSDLRKVARLQRRKAIISTLFWFLYLAVAIGCVCALIGGFWLAVAANSPALVGCILFLALASVPTFNRCINLLK